MMMSIKRIKKLFLINLLLVSSGISSEAMAHKVNLFAYAEANQVYVEGYFVDGKKAQNSQVQVFSADGKLLHEGITDEEGQYRFPVPQKTDLKIVVNAGMGHQSDFLLPASELGAESINNAGQQTADHTQAVVEQSAEGEALPLQSASDTLNHAQLEAVVTKAVNEAIKPLVRELSASQEKASLSGIVGGVGYIIGFLGLFAFFKARQDTRGK